MTSAEKVIKELSEELGIPRPIISHIVSHQFNYVRQSMEDGLLDNILLHNFGTFKVKKQRIDALIRSLIRKVRNGSIDEEEGKEEIKKLWKIRQTK
jgi:nucleoid DNA-binding protein